MEGYTIRRTLKMKEKNIGVYFKNNESPPLFVMSDLIQLVSDDYVVTKKYVAIAGPDHCVQIQANTSYMIWACDLEGVKNIIYATVSKDEQNDIIDTIYTFVYEEHKTIPDSLTGKGDIKSAAASTFDSIVTVMSKYCIRYVTVNGKVYFAAQDIRRCFQRDESFIEEKFEAIKQEDKLNVTFKDNQTRLCLNSNAVETVVYQIMDPDTAINFMVELISKCEPTIAKSKMVKPRKKKKEGTIVQENTTDIIKTTGNFKGITYDYIEVNGYRFFVCFAKRDPDDPKEAITPLFWATELGDYAKFNNINRLISEMCNQKDYCKITIPDIKKYNIKVVTLEGLQSLLNNESFKNQGAQLISDLQEAVNTYIEKHKDDLDFKLKKYNVREQALKNETVTTEEKGQDEEHNITLKESVMSFRGKELKIAVGITESNSAIIYFDIKQLCDILEVKEDDLVPFDRKKDNDGNDSLISIYDLGDALFGVKDNVTAIVQELFDTAKPLVISMAKEMGLQLKNNSTTTKEDFMSQLLSSSDSHNYILGAIILAERFREVVLRLKKNKREKIGLPGPGNSKLLEDLWKYIDCQEPDSDISFGFKKQVVIVNERYQRLKSVTED